MIFPYLAGYQSPSSFEDAQSYEVMVQEPELGLQGRMHRNQFQEAPPFLMVSKKIGSYAASFFPPIVEECVAKVGFHEEYLLCRSIYADRPLKSS